MFRVWVFDSQTTPGTTDSGLEGDFQNACLFAFFQSSVATFVAAFVSLVNAGSVVKASPSVFFSDLPEFFSGAFSAGTAFSRVAWKRIVCVLSICVLSICVRSIPVRSVCSTYCRQLNLLPDFGFVSLVRSAVQVFDATDRFDDLPLRRGCSRVSPVRFLFAVDSVVRPDPVVCPPHRVVVSRLRLISVPLDFLNVAQRVCSVPSSATIETAIAV